MPSFKVLNRKANYVAKPVFVCCFRINKQLRYAILYNYNQKETSCTEQNKEHFENVVYLC